MFWAREKISCHCQDSNLEHAVCSLVTTPTRVSLFPQELIYTVEINKIIMDHTVSCMKHEDCKKIVSKLSAQVPGFFHNAYSLNFLAYKTTVEPRFTNASHHEQIFWGGESWVTNSVSSNEHASRQQRLATSWEYWRESVSCCVTFTQYTSLPEFAMPSLEFHCVLWFFYILLNKTPWDQSSFGLRIFRVMNGLQERIKFVNRGSTVYGI
jgi:hypothetical protein